MFLILAGFCYIFFDRARKKTHVQAKIRAWVYAACGIVIITTIVVLGVDGIADELISKKIPRLTFYGENVGLVAFGIAWLIASRVLPVISSRDERFSILS